MKSFLQVIFFAVIATSTFAQDVIILKTGDNYSVSVQNNNKVLLTSPDEGLWSIATSWENNWPAKWLHARITEVKDIGEWKEVTGKISMPEGDWILKDYYRKEGNKIKCIRRFTWEGDKTLEKITLSVRWKVSSSDAKPFLPGILYYGNPSGYKNGAERVAHYHQQAGEEALFEEHRYPMPFSSVEWGDNGKYFGAALHTVPSPVYNGNLTDQWWALGLKTTKQHTELEMLSGPATYNGQHSMVKALQGSGLPYGDTYMKVTPKTVIEKTFYLEAYSVSEKGSGFQKPMYTSLGLFKPFYTDDMPQYNDIMKLKIRFCDSRWVEGANYAGYNMFPSFVKPQIVLGWAGQCEILAYAYQVLYRGINDKNIRDKIQRSLDHICTSPINEDGFCVIYDITTDKWHGSDPVSQGQAMNNIAMAIKEGRKNKGLNTKKWEVFLKKSADVFSNRILDKSWNPRNTAEAFFISPLILAAQLFKNEHYKKAAIKAADYYAKRHLSMDEPYWGGTLDATCEDKEGAWGAFQGFLAVYELTKDPKYLKYAKHACDVTLSYTVVWDIPLVAGRMADHYFKTRGWTGVSVQNQHLDVYGVVISPSVYQLGIYLKDDTLKKLAKTMFLSCGQIIDPTGSQGEQLLHTNFAQHGDMSNVFKLRGGYSEGWTVFWITAHFLNAAARFEAMNIKL